MATLLERKQCSLKEINTLLKRGRSSVKEVDTILRRSRRGSVTGNTAQNTYILSSHHSI